MYDSFIFDVEKPVSIKKLSKSKFFETLCSDDNFAYSVIGDKLLFIVFKNGKVRITYPKGDLHALKVAVSESAAQLASLFKELSSKGDVKFDLSDVLSNGKIEEDVEDRNYDLLPNRNIPMAVFREISMGSVSKLFGDYYSERILTFSGENFGRGMSAKTKESLELGIKKFIESSNLGEVQVIKPQKDEIGKKPFSSFRVYKSVFVYGLPPTGKAECYFIQALIRGAFARYLGQENINVVETKCWRKGDVYCEFNVHLLERV